MIIRVINGISSVYLRHNLLGGLRGCTCLRIVVVGVRCDEGISHYDIWRHTDGGVVWRLLHRCNLRLIGREMNLRIIRRGDIKINLRGLGSCKSGVLNTFSVTVFSESKGSFCGRLVLDVSFLSNFYHPLDFLSLFGDSNVYVCSDLIRQMKLLLQFYEQPIHLCPQPKCNPCPELFQVHASL